MAFNQQEIIDIAEKLYEVKYKSIFPDNKEVEKEIVDIIAEQISSTLKKNNKYETGYDFVIDLSELEGYDYIKHRFTIFDNKNHEYTDFISMCIDKLEKDSKYISLLSDYIDLNSVMKNMVDDYLNYYKKDLIDLADIFDIELVLSDYDYYIIKAD